MPRGRASKTKLSPKSPSRQTIASENEIHQDTPRQSQDDITSQLVHRFRNNPKHDGKRCVRCNEATIRYQTIEMIDLSILRNARIEDPATR